MKCNILAGNTLYLGGDVAEDTIFSLHNFPTLAESNQVWQAGLSARVILKAIWVVVHRAAKLIVADSEVYG